MIKRLELPKAAPKEKCAWMRTAAAGGGPGTPKQDVEGWGVRVFFRANS
jgi:hypothetical protein